MLTLNQLQLLTKVISQVHVRKEINSKLFPNSYGVLPFTYKGNEYTYIKVPASTCISFKLKTETNNFHALRSVIVYGTVEEAHTLEIKENSHNALLGVSATLKIDKKHLVYINPSISLDYLIDIAPLSDLPNYLYKLKVNPLVVKAYKLHNQDTSVISSNPELTSVNFHDSFLKEENGEYYLYTTQYIRAYENIKEMFLQRISKIQSSICDSDIQDLLKNEKVFKMIEDLKKRLTIVGL